MWTDRILTQAGVAVRGQSESALANEGNGALSQASTARPRFVITRLSDDRAHVRRVAGEKVYQKLHLAQARALQLSRMGVRTLFVEEWRGKRMVKRTLVDGGAGESAASSDAVQVTAPTAPRRQLSAVALLRQRYGCNATIQVFGNRARIVDGSGRVHQIESVEALRDRLSRRETR